MFCINCGKNLPDDAKFCSGCGKQIETKEKEIINTVPLCPSCGEELKPDDKFCIKCGTVVNTARASNEIQEQPAETAAALPEQAATPTPEAASPQAKTGLCAKCGAQLKEGLKFCTKCGTPVGAAAVVTAQAVSTELPQTKPIFKPVTSKGGYQKGAFGFYDGKQISLGYYTGINYNFILYVDGQLITEGSYRAFPFIIKKQTIIETKYKFSSGEKVIQCFFKDGFPTAKLSIFINGEYIGGDQF